ncbi:MAG TPA: DUF932 domain-containing protein [Candidatus Rifleibacterium sp.]|nr:DUF932 domain-containing protein [Candidatus Rifleibacterium sp.]
MTHRKYTKKDLREAFFYVESQPVYLHNNGYYQKLSSHNAIVDVQKGRVFAVVTKDYELVTNEEAYLRAGQIVNEVFATVNLEELECFNIIMPRSRSFCHIDLVKKDLSFSPFKDDQWWLFLRITNSYNKTKLLRYDLGFCRAICMNGVIFGAKSVEFVSAHTRGQVSRITCSDNLEEIRLIEKMLTQKLHNLKRFYVPETAMWGVFCKTFDLRVTGNESKKRKEALIEISRKANRLITEYCKDMGPHGYAALNVLSDYATEPAGLISSANQINNFQRRCGDWIDEFVDSIQKPDFTFEEYLGEYREYADNLQNLR